ncbi:MAG: glycosyltransferase family 2 protein [Bacteroidota bacterium]
MSKISAVIITKNEADNIQRCISSLEGVADEVLVLDAYSEDETVEIATSLGARCIQREWVGFAASKNYANSLATHPYILSLDADEALSEALRASLLKEKALLAGAYTFNRLTNYCGKWVRHGGWYPDVKLRLFPKQAANWQGDFVHEKLVLKKDVPTSHLSGDILHYSITSVEDHLERINRYSSLAAEDMFNKGKKGGWIKRWLSPGLRFLKMYLLKGGFLDGYEGYLISKFSAFSTYLRYVKLREKYQHAER